MSEPQPLRDFRAAVERGNVSANAAKQFEARRNGKRFPTEFTAQADELWERSQKVSPASGMAEPHIFGTPFHNPYTFIPFPKEGPIRREPTPITIDEEETDRFTGVIDLEFKLLSPLMTNHPEPESEQNDHKTFQALTMGEDVILPATGVRGALRNLLTILTGGTLGYIDEEAWLCQGRDLALGGRAAILAEVVAPGSLERPGKVRLGDTKLVFASDLENAPSAKLQRPRPNKRVTYLWSNSEGSSLSKKPDEQHEWKVKLSGMPVGGRQRNKFKQEGLFKAKNTDSALIELPTHLWAAYAGRNRHGDHPELHEGDLVWLEPTEPEGKIKSAKDIASIQWARWGRRGTRLLDLVDCHHPELLPDAFNPDGLVDEVTDLFGHIPRPELCAEIARFRDWKKVGKPGPAPAFAARVRPGNLVFPKARRGVERCTLAPLSAPHPGCAAFYRDAGQNMLKASKTVSNTNFPLRGFKVYRTSQDRGKDGPWRYDAQPVFGENGLPKPSQQKVNKTTDLLPPGNTGPGRLQLTVRALSRRELALVLAACCLDWRLGGGKPLGLGHCRVSSFRLRPFNDKTGNLDGGEFLKAPSDCGSLDLTRLPLELYREISEDESFLKRLKLWQLTQTPVEQLRYPRAVSENRNSKSRGGHVWFGRHANPKKSGGGLECFYLDAPLEKESGAAAVRGQPLPHLDPNNPLADVLFGYDLFIGESHEWVRQAKNRQTLHKKFEPFDQEKHKRTGDRSGGFQGQNRDSRKSGRRNRRR